MKARGVRLFVVAGQVTVLVVIALLFVGCAFLAQIFGLGPKLTILQQGTEFSSTGDAFDFGYASPGDPNGKGVTFVIQNDMSKDVSVSSITFSDEEFSAVPDSLTVPGRSSATFSGVFRPTSTGPKHASATISVAGSSQAGAFNVKGTGNYEPQARFSVDVVTAYDFNSYNEVPEAEGRYDWSASLNGGVGAYVYSNSSNASNYYLYQLNDSETWDYYGPGWHWLLGTSFGEASTAIDYEGYGSYGSYGGTQLAALPPDDSQPNVGTNWASDSSSALDLSKAGIENVSGSYTFNPVFGFDTLSVTPFDFVDRDGDASTGANGSPTYQWQSSNNAAGPFVNMPGATATTLDLTAAGITDKWVRCVVTVHAQTGTPSGSWPTQAVYVNQNPPA